MFPRLIHPHDGIVVGQDDLQGGGVSNHKGDPCLVLTADPKPRLRWTQDLHERFVDAVTQLGGPSSESFFIIYIYIYIYIFYLFIYFFFVFAWNEIGRVSELAVCDVFECYLKFVVDLI